MTFHVGSSKIIYHVHLSPICDASPVFKAAFAGEFSESNTHTMHLPDDDVEAFDHFTQWLYGRECIIMSIFISWLGAEAISPYFMQLAKLYVFADKYDVEKLKHHVIDCFLEGSKICHGHGPIEGLVPYLYSNSMQTSPLRRSLADWHVWHVPMKDYGEEGPADFLLETPEFAADLALALAKRVGNPYASNPFERKGNRSALYIRTSKTEKPSNEQLSAPSRPKKPDRIYD